MLLFLLEDYFVYAHVNDTFLSSYNTRSKSARSRHTRTLFPMVSIATILLVDPVTVLQFRGV